MGIRLLIVDDDEGFADDLREQLSSRYECFTAANREDALRLLDSAAPDAVVTDIMLEENRPTGFDLLKSLKEKDSALPVIVISERRDSDLVFRAGRLGGDGYLGKPFSVEELIDRVESALRTVKVSDALSRRSDGTAAPVIVCESPSMRKTMEAIATYAPVDTPVLLLGETGTGKTLLAGEIHRRSARADRPFLSIDCPNMRKDLVRSELFGHEKGAFTGAHQRKRGLCELADGGTIFLDEVADLELGVQGSLLRLVEEGAFERIGGDRTFKVDVRVIAATKSDLAKQIRAGKFRDDLFYRLNVCPIKLDPLRERREDVKPLAEGALHALCRKYSIPARGFTAKALGLLLAYSWPGNVRELKHVLERVSIRRLSSGSGGPVSAEELDIDAGSPDERSADLTYHAQKQRNDLDFKKRYLTRLLRKAGGDVSTASEISGLPRGSIYRMMREVGMSAGVEPQAGP